MDENGECGGGGGSDLMIWCECGAGICSVEPLIMNRRFLFVCCPKGPADGGGCGFMQWRDTVDLTNITTWNNNYSSPFTTATDTPPNPITTAATDTDTDTPPNPIPTTDTGTDTDTDTPPNPIPTTDSGTDTDTDTPPNPIPTAATDTGTDTNTPPITTTDTDTMASQDIPAPPPPQMMMCSCGAGACSVGTAKNGRNFYSCSSCKFRKWCDAGSSSQCYICRMEGHWSMDCPRLPPSAAAAAANNKKICFYCKQEDHYAAQCPFKYRTRRRN